MSRVIQLTMMEIAAACVDNNFNASYVTCNLMVNGRHILLDEQAFVYVRADNPISRPQVHPEIS